MSVFRYVWAFPNTLIGLVLAALILPARGRAQVVDGILEVHGPLAALLLRRCIPKKESLF